MNPLLHGQFEMSLKEITDVLSFLSNCGGYCVVYISCRKKCTSKFTNAYFSPSYNKLWNVNHHNNHKGNVYNYISLPHHCCFSWTLCAVQLSTVCRWVTLCSLFPLSVVSEALMVNLFTCDFTSSVP